MLTKRSISVARQHLEVLIISGFWPREANSISGIFVVQQITALNRLGIFTTVIVPTSVSSKKSPLLRALDLNLDPKMVRLIEVLIARPPEPMAAWKGILGLGSYLFGHSLKRAVEKLLSASEFSGCIVHDGRYIAASIPVWRHLINGKVSIIIHGFDPLLSTNALVRSRNIALFQAAERAADSIILVGSVLIKYVKSLGFSESNLKIIANGTNTPSPSINFSNQRPLTMARKIVSVSNLLNWKGIDDNLFALSEISLRRPELLWHYDIIGDGVEMERLQTLALKLGIRNRVNFLGRIPYAETMKAIELSDIFSLPSWQEAFGIVYLEAMSMGRPVIGCTQNGAADIISSWEDGVLIQPRSVGELSIALEELLASPGLCKKMGEKARETAGKFTWEINAKKYLKTLDIGHF